MGALTVLILLLITFKLLKKEQKSQEKTESVFVPVEHYLVTCLGQQC